MEVETLFNILTGQYGEILETHAMWECISALGIKPFKDGNQWCFLYGENIQEGVCGFGDTIYKAAWEFYTNVKIEEARNWCKNRVRYWKMGYSKAIVWAHDADSLEGIRTGNLKTLIQLKVDRPRVIPKECTNNGRTLFKTN